MTISFCATIYKHLIIIVYEVYQNNVNMQRRKLCLKECAQKSSDRKKHQAS